jgi:hypothetical protein
MHAESRDLYSRKPVSNSRGRTDDRILAMQHAPDQLPGAEELLGDSPPEGSIAAAVRRFHADWVVSRPITSRRAYERALVLLVNDLAENGPSLDVPIDVLTPDRLVSHLQWRAARGMVHPGDVPRAAVNLARFLEHANDAIDGDALRDRLRDVAAQLVSAQG